MVDFSKKTRTPSFLSGGKKDKKTAGRASAANDLSAAEIYASNKPATPANSDVSTASVANAESESDSLYTGSGRPQRTNGKRKGKAFLKKRGPLVLILTMILGGGAAIFSSNSLLGPHLNANLTAATDTQYASYALRSSKITQFMFNGDGQISTSWRGAKKYTTFTPYMKSRLKKNGIEIGHLDTDGNFADGDFVAGKKRVLKFGDEVIEAKDFSVRYATDPEFREAYYKAKRGRVGCFFDKVADKIYSKLGLSRNVFRDLDTSGDTEADEAEFKKTVADQYGDSDNTASTRTKTEETDENGKTKVNTDDDPGTKTKTDVDPDADSYAKATKYLDSVSKASQIANAACGIIKVGNIIAVAIAANEYYQDITHYQTYMEPTSKMMAGDGDESANISYNMMVKSQKTSTTDMSKVSANGSNDAEIEVEGSMLEAEGVKLGLGSTNINLTKVGNYSSDKIKFAFTTTAFAMTGCSVVQAGAAIVSIVGTVASLGIGSIVSTIVKTTGAAAVQIAISAALAWLIPIIARSLFSNPSTLVGIVAGEHFAKGAEASNSRVHRSGSGGSPSSKEAALAYNKTTQQVLAMDAEIDRMNHSPFDITNENTFLGSIFSKFLTITATSHSSATSIASNFSNLANSSIASLVPNTYADGEGTNYQTTFGNCPTLEAIGAVGDIYCNPITTTDIDTINISPDDVNYTSALNGNQVEVADDGAETIVKNSNLYKYINYCTERDSPFGIVDANILNDMNVLGIENQTTGAVVSSIPIIGDLLDVYESANNEVNAKWADGRMCVNSNSNSSWDSEMKYYQRYIEDNRILEQMGAIETNPVTVAKEDYLKDHPLDNSEAGYLSRIAGITKEDAEMVLAIADYYKFQEDYDGSTKFAFHTDNKEKELIEFNSEGKIFASLLNPIIFNDIRNRSYAA